MASTLILPETAFGRFHTQTVRFYEFASGDKSKCYIDATWGLVALHIIQKTPVGAAFHLRDVRAGRQHPDQQMASPVGGRGTAAMHRAGTRAACRRQPHVCLDGYRGPLGRRVAPIRKRPASTGGRL